MDLSMEGLIGDDAKSFTQGIDDHIVENVGTAVWFQAKEELS